MLQQGLLFTLMLSDPILKLDAQPSCDVVQSRWRALLHWPHWHPLKPTAAASPLHSVPQARLVQQSAGEEALLRYYHAQLMEGLRQLAGSSGQGAHIGDPAAAAEALERYSYEAMFGDYQIALCDYVRWMAGW